MSHPHILCIDDNREFLFNLKTYLKFKYQVSIAHSLTEALPVLKHDSVDLVFLDVNLSPDQDSLLSKEGIQLIRDIKKVDPSVIVIMLSAYKDPDLIVESIKQGASDYLCKPYPPEDLIPVIEKNLARKSVADKNAALFEYCNASHEAYQIIGHAPALIEVQRKLSTLKGHDANVLIEGESGTGKELFARYLHAQENNSKRPFIAVNCAAIPETLIESELFGYERGAFTGAYKRKIGKFELAHGGDLFLDEIDAVSPEFQAKLLRVLQDKEINRVGGVQTIKVDTRVIVATNKNLQKQVEHGHFRSDLFYRLRVMAIPVPALRDRPSDIGLLVTHFMQKFSPVGKLKTISLAALDKLQTYAWPGNVRELENLIQSIVIMSDAQTIEVKDLPVWLVQQDVLQRAIPTHNSKSQSSVSSEPLSYQKIQHTLKDYLSDKENHYIKRALKENRGNISKAARLLGVSRNTLYNRIAKNEGEFYE